MKQSLSKEFIMQILLQEMRNTLNIVYAFRDAQDEKETWEAMDRLKDALLKRLKHYEKFGAGKTAGARSLNK